MWEFNWVRIRASERSILLYSDPDHYFVEYNLISYFPAN